MQTTRHPSNPSRVRAWGAFLAASALVLGARTSQAHVVEAAIATPDCETSSIDLRFTGIYMLNGPFSIPYEITFACSDGGPAIPPIAGTAEGIVDNNPPGMLAGTFDITVTQPAAALAGRTCLVSGTATLFQYGVQYNTVAITDPAGETEFEVSCEEPPPPVQGCTPGYWKQPHHFDSWVGYAPGDSFSAVFGRSIPKSPSLLGALKAKGGGLSALMRHATAALLNASNPDVAYPYGVGGVITLFQQAFDSGNYNAAKDMFEGLNETGCPLN